jgi:hypothetical protein
MVLGLLKNAMSSRMVVIAIVFFKTVIINMIYLRVFIIILIRVGLTFDIWESRSLQGVGALTSNFEESSCYGGSHILVQIRRLWKWFSS